MGFLSGKVVLVVDDSPMMRRLIGGLLEAFGAARVWTAESGQEALEVFRRARSDIVITDLAMRPMDGLALVRALRDVASPNPRVPILMVTSHGDPGAVEAAREAGVDAFMTKPVVPAALRAHLAAALSDGARPAPAAL